MNTPDSDGWHKTACIICALNCGLEVQTNTTDRRITKIRGDKAHPVSQGYVCEKSQRMDYYQNGADRLSSPMRRRPGRQLRSDRLGHRDPRDRAEVQGDPRPPRRREHPLLRRRQPGQPPRRHLRRQHAEGARRASTAPTRSRRRRPASSGSAARCSTTGAHGDFEHCEVAVFVGKNPWHSHGFARTRVVLREIQKDPNRSLIVIDPRRSETAEMADFHLQAQPGTDAWCLAALAAILVQEDLVAHAVARRAHRRATRRSRAGAAAGSTCRAMPRSAAWTKTLLRQAARRIAQARRASR